MSDQSVQQVMRILPDRFCGDHGRLRIHRAKHFHPFLLRLNESMSLIFLVRMGAHQVVAHLLDHVLQRRFHLRLLRPALLVGCETQIAVGDELDLLLLELGRFVNDGDFV